MKTVYIHGKLGKRFGEKWHLNVANAKEALTAIDVNSEGFFQYILEAQTRGVGFIALNKNIQKIKSKEDFEKNIISAENCEFLNQNREIHIYAKAEGSAVIIPAVKIFFKAVIATQLTVGSVIAKIVFAVGMQAVMNAISKPPDDPNAGKRKDPVSTKSYLMNGGQTRQEQGIAVPLGYGRLKIGATNISESERTLRKKSKSSNLLESYAEKEYVDLIGEGPIEGFVNKYGAKIDDSDITEGIYLNNVQVRNSSSIPGEKGTLNYILNEYMDGVGKPKFSRGEENESQNVVNYVSSITKYEILLVGGPPYGTENNLAARGKWGTKQARENGAKIVSHTVGNQFVDEMIFSFRAECSDGNDDGAVLALPSDLRPAFAIYYDIGGREYNVLDSHGPLDWKGVSFAGGTGVGMANEPGGGLSGDSGEDGYFFLEGVATSAYQFDIKIKIDPHLTLESGNGSYVFKVFKLNPEFDPTIKDKSSSDANFKAAGISRARNVQLSHVVEKINIPINYTNCSIVKMMVDSKNLNRLPERSYHVKLKRILLPSNYDPIARTYNGPWDGLMFGQDSELTSIHGISDKHKKWSDNPAWVFYDLLYNARYGVGKYGLDEADIDKWQLYKIAKYCDELVETDYPIETNSLFPRRFQSPNVVNSSNRFTIYIDPREYTGGDYADLSANISTKVLTEANQISSSEAKSRFESEFGNGSSFAGKEIAIFTCGKAEVMDDNEAHYKASAREGNILIERRAIISSSSDDLSVTLQGPALGNEIRRVLDGTVTASEGSNVLTGINTSFINQAPLGCRIYINENEYIIKEIDSNTQLKLNKNVASTIISSSGTQVYIKKVIGACANQINHEIVEPRFTANLYLTERREALDMLKSIASIFRGMLAYSAGKIFLIQDSLKKPVMLFNSSNVSKEGFSYSGVNKGKRISSVMVRFNNKNRDFQSDLVYEEDANAIQKFGYIEKEVMGLGISSESQARRLAKWILMTSQLETETVTFKTGQDAAYLYPGCIFEVSDDSRVGKNKSGRILGKRVGKNTFFPTDDVKTYNDTCSVLLDKFMIDEAFIDKVELTIACGNKFTSVDNLNAISKFETEEKDQDQLSENIFSEQFYKFIGSLTFSDNVYPGRQGQNAQIENLKLIQEFSVNLSTNTIERYQHGLKDGDLIKFYSGGVLPAPLVDNRIYYLINSTDNTFQVSLHPSSQPDKYYPVPIGNYGKDHWLNEGGDHYFYVKSKPGTADELTRNAVDRITVGSVYSIKGTFSSGTQFDGDKSIIEEQLQLTKYNGADGWYDSALLGWCYVPGTENYNGWVYSSGWMNWVHIDDTINNPEAVDTWVYIAEYGWIWLLDAVPGERSRWCYFYNYSRWAFFSGYVKFWMWDDQGDHEAEKLEYVNILDTEIEALVLQVHEGSGFWFTFGNLEDYMKSPDYTTQYYAIPLIDVAVPGRGVSKDIHNAYYVSAQNSVQGVDSIRLQFNDGHGFDLIRNPSLVISGAIIEGETQSFAALNRRWSVIYVQENLVELVDSGIAAVKLIDRNLSTGEVSWDANPSVNTERYYERQRFRVLSVKEVSDNQYEIAGLEYNASKFLAVDRKGAVRKPYLPIPPQADMEKPTAPTNLVIQSLN